MTMKLWHSTQPGTLRSTGATLSLFSIAVALVGGFLSSFFLMVALAMFLIGLVMWSVGHLAERHAGRSNAKPA